MQRPVIHHNEMEHSVVGPDFRWAKARRIARSGERFDPRNVNDFTRQAISFLQIVQRDGLEKGMSQYSVVAAAIALRENVSRFQTLQMLVLGQIPDSEIANRMAITIEVIAIAKSLFFDIDDFRTVSSWMNSHVFLPQANSDDPGFAAKMKLAYLRGPATTRTLLDAEEVVSLSEAERIIDQQVLLHTRLQVALSFPLNEATSEEFVRMFLEYDLERRRIDAENERIRNPSGATELGHQTEVAEVADG